MTNRIANLDLHKEAVAGLFGVWAHAVTPAMLKRVYVLRFLLSKPEPSLEEWPDCPVCKQSATGRYYNGTHGCTRCGWSAGGSKRDKRSHLYD